MENQYLVSISHIINITNLRIRPRLWIPFFSFDLSLSSRNTTSSVQCRPFSICQCLLTAIASISTSGGCSLGSRSPLWLSAFQGFHCPFHQSLWRTGRFPIPLTSHSIHGGCGSVLPPCPSFEPSLA